jgi:hypothetical protein
MKTLHVPSPCSRGRVRVPRRWKTIAHVARIKDAVKIAGNTGTEPKKLRTLEDLPCKLPIMIFALGEIWRCGCGGGPHESSTRNKLCVVYEVMRLLRT